MKRTQLFFVFIAVFFSVSSCNEPASLVSIEKGFREIPDSIRAGAYWYWISDNI